MIRKTDCTEPDRLFTDPWFFVAGALSVWAVVSLALARSAETRAARKRPPISWLTVGAAIAVGACALACRATPAAAAACGLACIALVAAADADARTGYLFDAVTLPAAILTTFVVVVAGTTFDAMCGVALLVGTFGAIVIVSKGRWMGLGDVKAMFAIGAAFGPLESLIAIFAACVSGLAVTALSGRLQRGATLRFGPHLAAGAAFALVAGDPIVHRWMGL